VTYVLVVFMSDAAPTSKPEAQPSRSGRLLALVRKLIDYGRELAATARHRVAADPAFARQCFGTAELTVIFARITRGLLLAQALEERVLRRAVWLNKGPRPRKPRPAPRPKLPAFPPAEQRLARLPTVPQIAAEIRRRPIGAVIADICRDLGIAGSHPLWREVQHALIRHGGSLARLIRDILDRAFPLPRPQSPAPEAALPAYPTLSGTGPP
jgi:hypothetical protein